MVGAVDCDFCPGPGTARLPAAWAACVGTSDAAIAAIRHGAVGLVWRCIFRCSPFRCGIILEQKWWAHFEARREKKRITEDTEEGRGHGEFFGSLFCALAAV